MQHSEKTKNLLQQIQERKLPAYLQIKSERLKPVTEKNIHDQLETWDNLQVELVSTHNKLVGELTVYLHYYDQDGHNLGNDFDLVNKELKQGDSAYLSISLEPPDHFAYVVLEVEAEEVTPRIVYAVYMYGMFPIALYILLAKDLIAASAATNFVVFAVYIILLRILAYFLEKRAAL